MQLSGPSFEGQGVLLKVPGNRPVLLDDPDSVWLVESGQVDVFAVELQDREPSGPRRHVMRAGAGQVLFGIAPADGLGLLACGNEATSLRRLSHQQFRAMARGVDGPAIAQRLEEWLTQLAHRAAGGPPPRKVHAELVAGQTFEFDAGQTFESKEGCVWVRHDDGESLFVGHTEVPALGRGELCPLTGDAWLQARTDVRLSALSTVQWMGEDPGWVSLNSFNQRALLTIKIHLADVQGRERQRLRRREQADQQRIAKAMRQLAAVLEPGGRVIPRRSVEPLLAACQMVGSAGGIEICAAPPEGADRPIGSSLEMILQASRVRSRRVLLAGDWWRRDNGPLLGFLADTSEPVALLPASARKYVACDPATGTRRPVDAGLASSLQSHAHEFYRPLPTRPVGVRELLKTGLSASWRDILTLLAVGALGGGLSLAVPLATGAIFGSIVPRAELAQLLQVSLALLVAGLAAAAFQFTRGMAMLRLSGRAEGRLQAAVWDRLLGLPVPFFRDYTAGDLAMRAMSISAIREALSGTVVTTVLSAVFSVFSLALLFYYSSALAVIALGLLCISTGFTAALSYVYVKYQRQRIAVRGKLAGTVLQFLVGINKLRTSAAESRAFAHWAELHASQRRLTHDAHGVTNVLAAFNAGFPILASMVIFAALIAPAGGQHMSTGEFLAFYAAFGQLLVAGTALGDVLIQLLKIVPHGERAKPILEAIPEFDETKAHADELAGGIEVSRVSFRYAKDSPEVLDDVSLTVEPGQFVALVGPSGSGKSTLLRLLLGFEEPEAGAIHYDGQDLSTLDVRSVRRQMGVVLQNGMVMSGSVLDNVVGGSSMSLDEAWEAARMAGLAEDIEAMPMGMYTLVTQGGSTLSGGQCQRLLIARALVTRPRILFFDEATSALDNRTQAVVTRSLEALRVTRIVVAHRLSTIVNADKIVVLADGKVMQTGNYEELIQQEGVFAALAKRQIA